MLTFWLFSMITLSERVSQDICDLLLEFNLIDPDTYEYGELRMLLIELISMNRITGVR